MYASVAKLQIILELLLIMDIKDFAKLIERKRKELDTAMRRRMPGHSRAYGQRPFPGQLPAGRVRQRRTAPGGRKQGGCHRVALMPPASTARCFPDATTFSAPSSTCHPTTGSPSPTNLYMPLYTTGAVWYP